MRKSLTTLRRETVITSMVDLQAELIHAGTVRVRLCGGCAAVFVVTRGSQRFCGESCRNRAKVRRCEARKRAA